MGLTVRIPTPLRKFTGDRADVEASGATLGELLDDLESNHPGIKENLVDAGTGGLRRFVNVYVNDEDVRFLEGTETPLKDGDSVTIVPAIAGGRC
jgi:MoaD family protein